MHFQSSTAIAEWVEEIEKDCLLPLFLNLMIISLGLKGCRLVTLNPE